MVGLSTRYGKAGAACVEMAFAEILTEVSVDEYLFKVTVHPWLDGCCVLWFRDARTRVPFEALGRFTRFDKRDVLFFVARYATNPELRHEIDARRFERRLDGLTPEYFDHIERHSRANKTAAFRNLFNLDAEIEPTALARRRRIMARKFHPDAGGDDRTMSLINQAYEHLAHAVAKK